MIPKEKSLSYKDVQTMKLVVPPTAGATYGGIRHGAYTQYIHDALEGMGGTVLDGRYATNRHDMNLIAMYHVRLAGLRLPPNMAAFLGVVVGNDRKHRGHYYAGLVHTQGDWEIVCREYVVPTRRREDSDVRREVTAAIAWWLRKAPVCAGVPRSLEARQYTPTGAWHVLGAAAAGGLIPHGAMVAAADTVFGGRIGNGYGLARAFALATRTAPPIHQLRRLYGFYKLLTRKEKAAA